MDINSLLSPQESNSQSGRSTTPGAAPTSAPSSGPAQKNFRRGGRANTGRQGMTSSPLAQHVFAPPAVPEPSPPALSPSVGPSGTPPAADLPPSRQPSTPGMDTLADLASMQHHQPPRSNAPIMRGESYESQLSPSTMYPNVNPIAHNTPTPR